MIIKKDLYDFSQCPPYLYLKQTAEYCPKAVATYLALWRNKNNHNKLTVYQKDVRTEYLISLAKFRHDILLLVKEGLVSVDETDKALHIELVGWDNE